MGQGHYKILYLKVGTFSSLRSWRNSLREVEELSQGHIVTDVMRKQTYIYLGKSYALSIITYCLHTKEKIWLIYRGPYIRISAK